MMLMKLKLNQLVVLLLTVYLLNGTNCFDCDQNLGCLFKKKFYTYISNADTRGTGHKMESNINYKNIFVFRDKIVFYKATLPQENIAEQEVANLNPNMNESFIERMVPFRHLIMECGKYQTRICHAKELPNIAKSDAFKTIKSKIANADEKCVTFSFFDNSFGDLSQKIAVMCITDPRQVKDLLSFKNFLSRTVARYHLLEANTRYDASAGIEVTNGHFISYIKNKPVPVYASLRSKSILITTDDKSKDFLDSIKLLGMRNTGAYHLRRATELKKLKDGWSDNLTSPPPLDCCIIMPGDDTNSLLCIPNQFKKNEIEIKKDRCAAKVARTLKVIWSSLRKIQFSERLSKLVTDLRVSQNCAAKEYQLFKNMVLDAGKAAINVDCKILMQYSPDLFMTKKDYCLKHYVDEMEMMVRLVALGNKGFWGSLKNCVYHKFGIDFSDKYIMTLMSKAGIDTQGPKSFLQTSETYSSESELEASLENENKTEAGNETEVESEHKLDTSMEEEMEGKSEEKEASKETDDADDDDAVIEEKPKPVKLHKARKNIPYVFAEVASKESAPSPAQSTSPKKELQGILYNKPTHKIQPQLMDKIKILRENSMRSLQKTHVWTPAKSERQHEGFSKIKYQQGNKNADLFVSFLGYIRDTSYKQSPPLFEKIKKRFIK